MSASIARWAAAGVVVFLGAALLFVAARSPEGRAAGPITVQVPGAITVAVFCGRGKTTHALGESARLVPASRHCHVEAPLSPVMPLRGTLQVEGAGTYTCRRVNMDLDCRRD